jgi:YD repeat-containing protein
MSNKLVTTYKAWRKYRQTYNELAQLSNRDLADVGIRRSEISAIARQSASQL